MPSTVWICGTHACTAALNNPKRVCHKLLVTNKSYQEFANYKGRVQIDVVSNKDIENILQTDISHQGVLLQASHLPEINIKDYAAASPSQSIILLLDQITDTRNVGAILRSAAAFGVSCVIMQTSNAAPETAALAKSASGALEIVPIVRVTNIARTITYLKSVGYWVYGFDCDGSSGLRGHKFDAKSLLIMGSENSGMRRLVKEHCDFLVRIDINNVQSLNVSVAAGIVLYHCTAER